MDFANLCKIDDYEAPNNIIDHQKKKEKQKMLIQK